MPMRRLTPHHHDKPYSRLRRSNRKPIHQVIMEKKLFLLIVILMAMAITTNAQAQDVQDERTGGKWDKVFPLSETVNHRKVEFKNRYGITLVGDLYTPKSGGNRMALAVCGPFGASKEQSSGLYAMKMAERGFVTCAFDPSFTGESGR